MGADLPGRPVCNCAWLVLFRAGENQDIMAQDEAICKHSKTFRSNCFLLVELY